MHMIQKKIKQNSFFFFCPLAKVHILYTEQLDKAEIEKEKGNKSEVRNGSNSMECIYGWL